MEGRGEEAGGRREEGKAHLWRSANYWEILRENGLWNGWPSDPLPSACARGGVARFISSCSVVLQCLVAPAGPRQTQA